MIVNNKTSIVFAKTRINILNKCQISVFEIFYFILNLLVNECCQLKTLSSHDSNKKLRVALVTQGGGQRGVFTAGVLDSFIDAGFDPFELYIGTSAGALNLVSYLAGQYSAGYEFIVNLTTDHRFFDLFKYIRRYQCMDLDWAFSHTELLNTPFYQDKDFIKKFKGRDALACVTHAKTLTPEYLPLFNNHFIDVLRATCAIPFLYPKKVEIENSLYIDGGVSSPVPVREAFDRGADVIVVIRTELLQPSIKSKVASLTQMKKTAFRTTLDQRWSYYSERWKLNQHLKKVMSMGGQLMSRLKNSSAKAKIDASTEEAYHQFIEELPEMNQKNGGRWLFNSQVLYRLQTLKGQQMNAAMLEVLMKHLQSYQDTINFLNAPPKCLDLLQICPSAPLRSKALLSREVDLKKDYLDGVGVGKQFLSVYGETLMERSAIRQGH